MECHCQIVGQSLRGDRPVDEQTGISLEILAERLERLRHRSSLFAGVTFSPYVEKMKRHAEAVAMS